jgi:hypothetical protein
MASTWKSGWLVAEPIVLLTGLFTVLVYLPLRSYTLIDTLLIFSTFIPVIPSVAIVSFAIWAYRGKVSNRALVGSTALGCYSWLQVAFGFGAGIFGLVFVLFPVMLSLYCLNASWERRHVVNN